MSIEKKRFYFDCDTGIDDAMALGYLLAEQESVEILGIGTVCGNISAQQGAKNTLNLLCLAGYPSVPVAVGENNYLSHDYVCDVQHIHGDNGIGDVPLVPSASNVITESAAELLIRLSKENHGKLSIIATGPLTNIAKALQLDPSLPERIECITIMGGAALAPGNRTPVAEANIACDPEAAAWVFNAMNNIVMVPLDVTMSHTFEEEDRNRLLLSGKPFARAIGEMLELYIDFYVDTYGRKACALHDPVAAVLAVKGLDACLAPKVKVVVDATLGPGRGQTICDMRGKYSGYPEPLGANCRVVLSTTQNMADLLVRKLLSVG